MCHRVLFGTSGTMANLPLTNNIIGGSHGQHHTMVSIDWLEKVESDVANRSAPEKLRGRANASIGFIFFYL
jgi:hypothetical protein